MLPLLRTPLAFLVLPLLVLVGSACERRFVEERAPEITVYEPADSLIFQRDEVPLSIKATSFRAIDRVEVNGMPLSYDPSSDRWETTLPLEDTHNRFIITAYDVNGVAGRDTIHLAHLNYSLQQLPAVLPEPRGGHTATSLSGGGLVIAGGAPAAGGVASEDVFWLPRSRQQAEQLGGSLKAARTGHTATRLPDGRILLLGGSRSDAPDGTDDLVRTAEIYDPVRQRSKTIPVTNGAAVQRTLHSACLHKDQEGQLIVDLVGGFGPVGSASDPVLGQRDDMRRFLLRSDTLIALDHMLGSLPASVAPLAGHTQTPLHEARMPDSRSSFLVAGSSFEELPPADGSFILSYTDGSIQLEAGAHLHLQRPRMRHAAAPLGAGQVLLFGGRLPSQAIPHASIELYIDEASRFFLLPGHHMSESRRFLRRYAHTANRRAPNHLFLLGGFSASGNGLREGTVLTIQNGDSS